MEVVTVDLISSFWVFIDAVQGLEEREISKYIRDKTKIEQVLYCVSYDIVQNDIQYVMSKESKRKVLSEDSTFDYSSDIVMMGEEMYEKIMKRLVDIDSVIDCVSGGAKYISVYSAMVGEYEDMFGGDIEDVFCDIEGIYGLLNVREFTSECLCESLAGK